MIYLDNSSSTQPKFFAKDYSDYWMNTNSFYSHKEQQALEDVKDRIKKCIGVKSGKVITGATASHLVEILMNRIPDYILCIGSNYEHDAIERYLDIRVDSAEELENHLRKYNEPCYVFWMLCNNVTGKVFDVESIGKLCHKYNAFFICDMTASVGKLPIPKNIESWCDCCFASSHKWHGEKNDGFMWLSDKLCNALQLTEQSKDEYGMKWGTTALSSILALTDALEYTISNFSKNEAKYRELHDYMFHYAMSKGLYIYEKIEDSCPAINAVTIPFVNGDALSNYLASKEIYVGRAGSACSEEHDFRVLKAFSYTEEQCENTIRVSFSPDNTLEDVEKLIESVIEFKEKF